MLTAYEKRGEPDATANAYICQAGGVRGDRQFDLLDHGFRHLPARLIWMLATADMPGRVSVGIAWHRRHPLRAVVAAGEVDVVFSPQREWHAFGSAVAVIESFFELLISERVGFYGSPRFTVLRQRFGYVLFPVGVFFHGVS